MRRSVAAAAAISVAGIVVGGGPAVEEEVADLADELCDCIKALLDVAVEYEILFVIAVLF
jgi:hypothetical protein